MKVKLPRWASRWAPGPDVSMLLVPKVVRRSPPRSQPTLTNARAPRGAVPRRVHGVPPRRDRGPAQPLEDGCVVVRRMVGSVAFPARFIANATLTFNPT